jgi:hypothetical protein
MLQLRLLRILQLWPEQFLLSVGDREAMQTKVTAGKTLKRAGATPLLTASSRPKFRGVAPARFVQIMTKHRSRCRSCYLDRGTRLESQQVLAEDGCDQIISAFWRHKYLSKRGIDEQRQ